jgi:hypothetical protein
MTSSFEGLTLAMKEHQPPTGMTKSFSFRATSMTESQLYSEYLSEKTRQCVKSCAWADACSSGWSESPEVYVCEAFGGASATELASLITAIEDTGKFVILVWTDDWAFPSNPESRSLVFDVNGQPPLSCTYGWNSGRYGPQQLAVSKPFAERRILASFVGSRNTHSSRDILFDASITNRPDMVIENVDWWGTARLTDSRAVRANFEARFADILLDSKFAFCPRGNGPSSKRRWEAAYCGAIPILIDDFTKPFGLELPFLQFGTQGAQPLRDNAIDLLQLTVRSIPEGEHLQARLRDCLLSCFDVPLLSSTHTTVRQIIDVANCAWVCGQGFILHAS